jgi:hypothetical protein
MFASLEMTVHLPMRLQASVTHQVYQLSASIGRCEREIEKKEIEHTMI